MTKECKHCKNQFVPTNQNRGHEQLYCSKKCGQISARIRRENKIKNEAISAQKFEKNSDEIRHVAQRSMGGVAPDGWIHSDGSMVYLEKLYEAKNENNYLKLKCENLEEKIRQLQIEINGLNSDIEAMETNEELGEQPGILGGLMQQFKTDPINTISMVKMMFQNLTAKNESNATTKNA